MDKEEITSAENLELRISEMKSQFQQSYEVFMKAHEELSKISFESLNLTSATGDECLGPLSQLEPDDVNEIIQAGSIDDCLSSLRSKIKPVGDEQPEIFPDVSKLLMIMSDLQSDIHSLTENQKQFSELTEDVNNEMSVFEKRMEASISQLDDLVVESLDGSDSSEHEDHLSDEDHSGDEDEETFGSDSLSN